MRMAEREKMIQEGINGVCMALADSVPGVSGGTIAFIMGFYDHFIASINNVVFGKKEEKISGLKYLMKLGAGWIVGMIAAVLVLSTLFETQIYLVSSLFIGFILGAIPLIIAEEKKNIKIGAQNMTCLLAGAAVVALITYYNSRSQSAAMDLSVFSFADGIKLFLIGMVSISAMFLPGISGSTLLLVFGAYVPVVTAVKEILRLQFSYIPSLLFFGCGVICGTVSVVKIIKICLEKFRPQTIFVILGMMIGSLYAIVMGPTTLSVPKEALSFSSFHIIACLAGLATVLGLHKIKERRISREG